MAGCRSSRRLVVDCQLHKGRSSHIKQMPALHGRQRLSTRMTEWIYELGGLGGENVSSAIGIDPDSTGFVCALVKDSKAQGMNATEVDGSINFHGWICHSNCLHQRRRKSAKWYLSNHLWTCPGVCVQSCNRNFYAERISNHTWGGFSVAPQPLLCWLSKDELPLGEVRSQGQKTG